MKKALISLAVVLCLPMLVQAQPVPGVCGCMDVVFVVDDTGSMGPAIDNVKAGLASIIGTAQIASDSDLKMGLVSFKDIVKVDQPFTTDTMAVTTAVNALLAGGGAGEPEASDEAVKYVATGATSCSLVGVPPLGAFRPECVKIAVLVTDATPGGCDDLYADGVDDVNALAAATAASTGDILISAVLVDNGSVLSPAHPLGVEDEVMSTYAATTGGVYTKVPVDGTGTADAINAIIATCGASANECPLSQGYWKNHPEAWPVEELMIGGTLYSKTDLLAVLNTPPSKGNAVLILAHQLIATELNIANGSDSSVISSARADAQSLLTGLNLLTASVRTNTATGKQMTSVAGMLDDYNNRYLTPDCEESEEEM